jgi:hypothetical protein
MIDGFIRLVAKDAGDITLHVVAQQPVTGPAAIEKCKLDKEFTAGSGSSFVEDVGARHAALPMEEGFVC